MTRTLYLQILVFTFCFGTWAMAEENQSFQQSLVLFQKQDYAGSCQILKELTATQPQRSIYWFNQGNCAYKLGQFDVASRCYQKVVELESPLAPAARLYLAKSYMKSNRATEAETILSSLRSEPTTPPGIKDEAQNILGEIANARDDEKPNPDLALNFYLSGRYHDARRIIEQKGDSLTAEETLLKAMIFLKLGEQKKAQTYLKQAVQMDRSGSTGRDARSLLEYLSSHYSEDSPYWLYADGGVGYDTNVYEESVPSNALASSLMRMSVATGFRFFHKPRWTAKLGYILNWENIAKASDLRSVSHTLQVPIGFDDGHFSALFVPYFQYQRWGDQSAFNRLGTRLKLERSWDTWDLGLDLDGASQKGLVTDYDYLDGTLQKGRMYVGLLGEKVYGQLYFDVGREHIHDIRYVSGLLPLDNNFSGPGARVIWRVAPKWVANFSVSQLQKDYAVVAQPGAKKRLDKQFWGMAKLAYFFTPLISCYSTLETTQNTSTLGAQDIADKNYQTTRAMLGFAWDVL